MNVSFSGAIDNLHSVRIAVDAKISSPLIWSGLKEIAQKCCDQKKQLFWDLDLGLFAHLSLPWSDEGQLHALAFSLDRFQEILWSPFREATIGVSLYRGSSDFRRYFIWTEEEKETLYKWLEGKPLTEDLEKVFCQQRAIEYLKLLSSSLSEAISLFILLDTTKEVQPSTFLRATSKEIFEHFHIAIKGPFQERFPGVVSSLHWNEIGITQKLPLQPRVGVVLPFIKEPINQWKELDPIVEALQEKKIFFHAIPELFLTTNWDRLDHLIVLSESITNQGRRKLLGFAAAGGVVVFKGAQLDIPNEISWENFLNTF